MTAAASTFRSQAAFRAWLKKHHRTETALVVRCFKVLHGDRGLTYDEALDEALCFGWIDGVRRGLDDVSYTVRFTPRKARSIWSRKNVGHVQRLIAAGQMTPRGLAAFQAREAHRTGIYSFEQPPRTLPPAYLKEFQKNRAAWAYFEAQAPWYRRTCTAWVLSAKREETRERRLATLIDCSVRGTPIGPLKRAGKS
jgi:uncharacterized protein YdeI (YjbR/CyaY-like superfamily)